MNQLRQMKLLFGILMGMWLPQVAVGAEVLERVRDQVQSQVAQSRKVVVVFDLDDTLFDTRSRTYRIFHGFAHHPEFENKYPAETAALKGIRRDEIQYELSDTLNLLGIRNPGFLEELKAYWSNRFFSGECRWDEVVPGAVSYVNALVATGAKVVYLTGRDRTQMGQGTLAAMRSKGMPLGSDGILVMKPDAAIPDAEFKESTLNWIATLGEVVAVFENEPRNLNLMKAKFPQAQAVFLETLHSSKPDVPVADAVRIRNYR